MNYGYARVSTDEQNLNLQLDALEHAGCEKIFKDEGVSGAATIRAGLNEALSNVHVGDILTVWRLDRLGRSLPHLITVIEELQSKGAGFKSLSESIDTTTAGGKLIFHIFGALAEFERSLTAERTKAGLQAAKKRGKQLGRPARLTSKQIKHAEKVINMGQETTSDMATLYGVNRSTMHRALKKLNDKS